MSKLVRDHARAPEAARRTLPRPMEAVEREPPRRLRNVIMVRTLRQQDAEIDAAEWWRLALWIWTPGIGFVVGIVLALLR